MSEGNGNGYVGRDAFFGGFERRFKDVVCPRVGVPAFDGKTLQIGNTSEGEQQARERWLRDRKGELKEDRLRTIRLKYIVDCCYNGNGVKLFSDADIPLLIEKDMDGAITRFLADEITTHCGYTKDDLEELAKN